MLAIWVWPQCVNRGTIVLYFTKHPITVYCKGAVLAVLEKLLWRQDGCSIRSSHHDRMEFPAPVRYLLHGDVIKWTHFRIAGLLRGEFTGHKGQWGGALMFSLICACTNRWANNGDAGELWRHRAHYDVIVMSYWNDADRG